MKGCQFHYPKTGDICGDEPATYGVTYEITNGRLSFKVCKPHFEYYLSNMRQFIRDNEKGWKKYLQVNK